MVLYISAKVVQVYEGGLKLANEMKLSDLPIRICYEEDGVMFDYATSLDTYFTVKAICDSVKKVCQDNGLEFKEKPLTYRGNLPEDSKGFMLEFSKDDLFKLLSLIGKRE